MMDATTAFTALSLMMLANGLVLVVVSRDLPDVLRGAARHWQAGTILIAVGCAIFAFGAPLPRAAMLLGANGAMTAGLIAYQGAVQRLCGLTPRRARWIAALIVLAGVGLFSTVAPDFRARVVIVSAVWVWILGSGALTLASGGQARSRSRDILVVLFSICLAYTAIRVVALFAIGAGPDFAIERDTGWINILSMMVMATLPIVGTTVFLLLCSDMLKRKLETAASTDYLTGLANRRHLAAFGADAVASARKDGVDLVVAVADIDHFKRVNDSHGHEAGDAALVHVSRLLAERIGDSGMAARTGGEEFTLVLVGVDRAHAAHLIEEMRAAVEREPFVFGEAEIDLTISIGAARLCAGDARFEGVLRRADDALYKAKTGGRNRVEMSRLTPLAQAPCRSAAPLRLVGGARRAED